jgi:hypothetical protein
LRARESNPILKHFWIRQIFGEMFVTFNLDVKPPRQLGIAWRAPKLAVSREKFVMV